MSVSLFKPKCRSIIPNESDLQKSKDKTTYSESYDLGGLDNKVKLVIKSVYIEKSNYEVHGNFLYQIKNLSHFDILSELNFSNSQHISTQEKYTFEPGKIVFKSHIEPYQDLIALKGNKTTSVDEEDGICKVQCNRGYTIKSKLKLAFTFPSPKKQLKFVIDDHKDIMRNLEKWKKYKASQIEQLLMFGFSSIYSTSVNKNKANTLISPRTNRGNITYNKFKENYTSAEILFNFASQNGLANMDDNQYDNQTNINNIVRKYSGNSDGSVDSDRKNNNIHYNNNNNNDDLAAGQKTQYGYQNPISPKNFSGALNYNSLNMTAGGNTNYSPGAQGITNSNQNEMSREFLEDNNKIYFVDESFPPCQIEYTIMDLNKEIKINENVSATEPEKNKKKTIIYHYRSLESLQTNPKQILYKADLSPYDIQYGLIKHPRILSVFSHLACHPKILSRLFPENLVNEIGVYKVNLFLNGAWSPVILDKFIPCFPLSFPIYTYSPTQLWPVLLEKAIAKTFKGYDKVNRLGYFELYQILTGFPVIHYKLIFNKSEKLKIQIKDDKECSIDDLFYREGMRRNMLDYTGTLKYKVNSKIRENKGTLVLTKDDIINNYLNFHNNNNNDKNEESYNNTNNYNEKKSYLLGFYASDSYLNYLKDNSEVVCTKNKKKMLSKKLFAVEYANQKDVYIKSIYNFQLKKYANSLPNIDDVYKNNWENSYDSLRFPWEMLFILFDNIILVKAENFDELHFRCGFVRCQDTNSPDFDRVLSSAYFELKVRKDENYTYNTKVQEENSNLQSIKEESLGEKSSKQKEKTDPKSISEKSKKSKITDAIMEKSSELKENEIIPSEGEKTGLLVPLTIVLSLSNEHFLDKSYYSKEMDMKIGILKLVDKQNKKTIDKKSVNDMASLKQIQSNNTKLKRKEKKKENNNIKDPFNGKNPLLIQTPDFKIGYSLVYDLLLEEGDYIIVPMTMGYCMQKNPNIKFKEYTFRDENHYPLPIQKTLFPKFIDDIFYLNDPFCRNYLDFKVVSEISKNILDNKGKKIAEVEEQNYDVIFGKNDEISLDRGNLGLSRLSFRDYIYELSTLIGEKNKKQSLLNLGYEQNTYPYLSRFFSIGFYFSKTSNHSSEGITVIPKNNLNDTNMDTIVNLRILEKNISLNKNAELNIPQRIYYNNKITNSIAKDKNDHWYTIEGVYMKKNPDKNMPFNYEEYTFRPNPSYTYSNCYFSTHDTNVTTVLHPGKLAFLLYVVEDILKENLRHYKSYYSVDFKKDKRYTKEDELLRLKTRRVFELDSSDSGGEVERGGETMRERDEPKKRKKETNMFMEAELKSGDKSLEEDILDASKEKSKVSNKDSSKSSDSSSNSESSETSN